MRATRRPRAPVAPAGEPGPARRDVIVRPVPLAMVWQGPGAGHAAIAVPGVSLGPGDVLVAVEFATICPADIAVVLGPEKVSVPLVLGHEQVGRIVALGDGAATSDGSRLVVGMRVVWSRRIGCGTCEACSEGSPSRCATAREYGADRLRRGWELSGGFATHVLVRAGTAILTVPEIVPAAVLASVPCATALAAAAVESLLETTEIDGETVAVVGADLVGLTVAAMLSDEGARVVMVEPDAARRARAREFGATAVASGLGEVSGTGRPVAVVVAEPSDGAVAHAAVGPGGVTAAAPARSSSVLGRSAAGSSAPGSAPVSAARTFAPVSSSSTVASPSLPSVASSAPPSFASVVDFMGDGGAVVGIRHGHGPTSAPRGATAGTPGAAGRLSVIERPDPRHLEAAVAFVSNAWYRFPFEELVAVRYPLERLDDALAAASTSSVLRIGLDTMSR